MSHYTYYSILYYVIHFKYTILCLSHLFSPVREGGHPLAQSLSPSPTVPRAPATGSPQPSNPPFCRFQPSPGELTRVSAHTPSIL